MLSGSRHTPQLVLTYTPTSLKRCPLRSTPSLATCSSINLSDGAVDPVEVKFLAHSTHSLLLLLHRVLFLYGKMCCIACIIVVFKSGFDIRIPFIISVIFMYTAPTNQRTTLLSDCPQIAPALCISKCDRECMCVIQQLINNVVFNPGYYQSSGSHGLNVLCNEMHYTFHQQMAARSFLPSETLEDEKVTGQSVVGCLSFHTRQ